MTHIGKLFSLIQIAILISCAQPVINNQKEKAVIKKKTLMGMHDTIGGDQSNGYDRVSKISGRSPDIWSSDFGFSDTPNDSYRRRDDLLSKALIYHKMGKMITLSYHQCNPMIEEPCPFDKGVSNRPLTKKEWIELLKEGSPLHKKWKQQWDKIAFYLKEMESAGIVVLFRPYHESNIPGFWWASESPRNSIALWHQLRKLFKETYHLEKIKWVWSVSYHEKYWSQVKSYYPGDGAVDVLGVDIYPSHKGVSPNYKKVFSDLKQISTEKKIALTELSKLPSQEDLHAVDWYYLVPWGINMLKNENSESDIKTIFGSSK